MIEHYKNLSLENIVEEIEGIVFVEEWKDILGFEGYYIASSFGRIKRLKRENCNNQHKNEIIMSQRVGTRGYLDVTFNVDGVSNTKRVARIIGLLFVPNTEKKPQINHIKGIKTDNRFMMIEWNTGSENQKHSFRELNRKPVSFWTGKKSPNAKKIYCIETGEVFLSATEAAKQINVSVGMISMACTGKRYTANNLHLKYTN